MTVNHTGRELLDDTVFLASLASERKVIDPLLDTVRTITASRNTEEFTESDKRQLYDVQQQIKKYLAKADPVRRISEAAAGRLLESRQQPDQRFFDTHPKVAMSGVLALAIILFGIGFSMPWATDVANRAMLALTFFYVGLHSGIAWFYLYGRKNFTTQLRQAYGLITTGVIVTGIGVAILPALQAMQLTQQNSTFFNFSPIYALFTLAVAFFYAGARAVAISVNVQSRATNWKMMLALIGTLACVSLTIAAWRMPDPLYWLALCNNVFMPPLCFTGAVLAWRASKVVTDRFAVGLRWFALCVAGIAIVPALFVPILTLYPTLSYGLTGFAFPVYVVTELLMFQAGYVFMRKSANTLR